MKPVEKEEKSMTQLTYNDRQKLLDAFMFGVPDEPHVQKEMAELARKDLELCEPVFLEILERERKQSFAQGKMQAYLEMAYAEQQRKEISEIPVPF